MSLDCSAGSHQLHGRLSKTNSHSPGHETTLEVICLNPDEFLRSEDPWDSSLAPAELVQLW